MENSEYLRIVTLLIAMIYDDIQRYNTLASPNDMNGDTFGDTIRLSGRGQQCLTGHSGNPCERLCQPDEPGAW